LSGIVGREAEFKETIEDAIFYSTTLNCPRIHIMAGVLKAHVAHDVSLSVMFENLKYAADLIAEAGIKVMIEPLNTIDVPWYLIGQTIQAPPLWRLLIQKICFCNKTYIIVV